MMMNSEPMSKKLPNNKRMDFILGVAMTLAIALFAKWIAGLPFFNIMGQLVIAILIGMAWRTSIGVNERLMDGIQFSSKKLLRIGIILLGMRLNMVDIWQAGPKVMLIAMIVVIFTMSVVYGLSRLFRVEHRLGMLAACGTAICGAAAVVAIAPQIKAKNEEIAIGAAIVAILGTVFTLTYSLLYPWLQLSTLGYGVFSGATLHEIAHVVAAAASSGSEAVDMAVLVKLSRVILLVPVAILLGLWVRWKERSIHVQTQTGDHQIQGDHDEKLVNSTFSWKTLPIPWFILGFLLVSGIHTLGIVPENIANNVVTLAYMLIAMAMAGLGLNVNLAAFRKYGLRSFAAGFIGSILLSVLGLGLIHWFGMANI